MHYTIMREVREENVHLFEPPIWNTPFASVGLLLLLNHKMLFKKHKGSGTWVIYILFSTGNAYCTKSAWFTIQTV